MPRKKSVAIFRIDVLGLLVFATLFGGRLGDSPVADAAMRDDVLLIRELLSGGADVNAAQGDGMTALHWAARRGNSEIVQLLIGADALADAMTRLGGYTPLHIASQMGHGLIVESLINAGSDPNHGTSTGRTTPLHFAAASGSAESVTALLAHGARIDSRETAWGQTALMFAAASNSVAVLQVLLDHGADIGLTGSVIDIAAREEVDRIDSRNRAQRLASRYMRAVPSNRGSGDRGSQRNQPGTAGPPQLRGSTEIDPLSYADLVGSHGGLSALHLAVREGHVESVTTLLGAGADINHLSAGDNTSPLLMATINGHFDMAMMLVRRGAEVTLASVADATPLYTTLNTHWVPKSRHPQPTSAGQQTTTYLELMTALLEAGADPNARLKKPLWFTTYNNDLLRVDRTGASPFWRAAYATDVDAMRLLVQYGADPNVATIKAPARSFGRRSPTPRADASGLPSVPIGGPAVYPIHAASGAGYGQGFAANSHRHVPDGWLPAVRYLVEELGADVNTRDDRGYNAVHHAAARGDDELIQYLVEQGADVTAVSRSGQTTVDMANGPVQRIQPFLSTIQLLEGFGAVNNHNCQSC